MEQAAEEECDEPEQQPGLGYYFFVLWNVGIGIVAAVCRPNESLRQCGCWVSRSSCLAAYGAKRRSERNDATHT